MTLRRFMWIFAAIGLAALALAGAGRWWLQWPSDTVGMWVGIGAGYLLGALAFMLMPRWWQQHCDDMYAQPAGRRYIRALWPIMIGYSLVLAASLWLLRRGVESVPLRALVALLPVVPLVLLMRAAVRYLREIDELQRRIETEAIGVACLLVSLVYFGAGLLQKAEVISIAADAAMIWVFPMTMLFYGVAKFFAVRRYR
jgi:hypothetical protein